MIFNLKKNLKVLSIEMIIVAAAMILPFVVAIIYGETIQIKSFALCIAPLAILGFILNKAIPSDKSTLRMRDGFLIVGISWLAFSIFGSLPFMISGEIPKFGDAFFETASGFSTTGATILSDVESLSKASVFWRSFTHWMGGMGILVLTVAILPMLGIGGQKIMRAETTGPTMEKISFKINDTARKLYTVYGIMTLAEIVLLVLGDMNLFDAIIHTFGTVGTGGFSNYNDSIAHFGTYTQIVVAVFMMLAGINFSLHYYALNGNIKQSLKDIELKVYLSIIAISTLFITIMLVASNGLGFGDSLNKAFFQVNTIITTTGYGTADFDFWPLPCKIIIFLLMIMGGCAGSTSGGIKVIRVMLTSKLIKRGADKKIHPKAVYSIKLGGKTVAEDTISAVASFMLLYAFVVLAGTFVVSFEAPNFATALTSVVSCVSNIGPGFDAVGPSCNFGFYSSGIKIFLSLLMIAGRLELCTIFVFFTPSFWDKSK